MRRLPFIALAAALCLTGACTLTVPAPLTTGLQLKHDSSAVLTDRLQRRFPVGTPDEEVLRVLRSQGFKEEADYGGEHRAHRNLGTVLVCAWGASAYWRVDDQDRLVSIRCVHQEEGCL